MATRYYKVRALNPSFDPRKAPCCNPCGKGEPCLRSPKRNPESDVSRRIRSLARRLARGETR